MKLDHSCIAVVLLLWATSSTSAQPPGGGEVPVAARRVEQRSLHLCKSFVGTIRPLRTSKISSPMEGLVVEYRVNEGDYVREDQVLARLRTTDLEIELAKAQAELELLQYEKAELELSKPSQQKIAKADMEVAESLSIYAEGRLARNRELAEDSPTAITEDELAELLSIQQAAQATFAAKEAAHQLASGEFWDRRIDQADAKVRAQQQAIRLLEDNLEQHTIRAPFAGYVTKEFTEQGQWVVTGGDVAEIIDIEKVDLEVPVLETYMPNLPGPGDASVGEELYPVEVEAYPDQPFHGSLVLIVPFADTQARSFPVKIRIENTPVDPNAASRQMKLRPGMFARVHLPVGERQDVILVPKDAIVFERREKRVFVVDIGANSPAPGVGTARAVAVEMGVSYGGLIEVHGDLEPGDLVVTEGNERLKDGRTVKIINLQQLDEKESAPRDSRTN